MSSTPQQSKRPRIGFVSTRIAGTDGVSLEIEKWACVLEEIGFDCYYLTGESDRPADRTARIEELHFNHPAIHEISTVAFSTELRTSKLTNDILSYSRLIRERLEAALEQLDIHVIVAENALTIPMNIPLGLAIVQLVQQTGVACVAHHHDFFWERDRFLINAVDDFLSAAFPPSLPQIQHVVINSLAGQEFSRRTGQSCRIIPNVMDFENSPPPPDEHAQRFRQAIGLQEEDLLLLQPTRVVERKGIEHAIELCRRLDPQRAKLVISHESGDEGGAYKKRIIEFAEMLGVSLYFVDDYIADKRGTAADGTPQFQLGDAFYAADFVTYPSEYEGFGNAFLEAVYYHRPVLCNRYSIYRTDIEPFGFRSVLFDGFLTSETIDEVQRVLTDRAYREEMVRHNYAVARRFFSFEVLRTEFDFLLRRPHNIYRLYGRERRFDQREKIITRLHHKK